MTDWIEHDGGPQPVADDVWVELQGIHDPDPLWHAEALRWEGQQFLYRILNQHLIDAARLEGIRLGLEAAAKVADDGSDRIAGEWREGCRADNYLQGQSDGMDEAATFIRALDPETIAREAVLDKLASEAQEQGMGYDRNVRYGVEVVRPPSTPLIAKEADQ
jgi:hypothetical protein